MEPAAEDNLLRAEPPSFSCLGAEDHKVTVLPLLRPSNDGTETNWRVQRVTFVPRSTKRFTGRVGTEVWPFLLILPFSFQLIYSILLPQITKQQ